MDLEEAKFLIMKTLDKIHRFAANNKYVSLTIFLSNCDRIYICAYPIMINTMIYQYSNDNDDTSYIEIYDKNQVIKCIENLNYIKRITLKNINNKKNR